MKNISTPNTAVYYGRKRENTMIKGYKGFTKDLKCNGFQYKENKVFKHKGEIKLCNSGLHFCTNPFDVLNYYELCKSEFAEVEAEGVASDKSEDSKRVCKKLKIGVRLGIKGFVEACVEFLLKETKPKDNNVSNKDYSKLASSGNYSKLVASGDFSQLASSGNYSQLAASGYSSQLVASGYSNQLAASGDSSQLAASGNYSKLAASGDSSKLAASGNSSKLAASGNFSRLAASGDSSIAVGIGINNIAQGKKGCWIVLAEWVVKDNKYIPVCVKSEKIDGKKLKENTYYKLENKKFVEVK
jgi:hypothetical protein